MNTYLKQVKKGAQKKPTPDQAVHWVGPIMKNKQNKRGKYNTLFLIINIKMYFFNSFYEQKKNS